MLFFTSLKRGANGVLPKNFPPYSICDRYARPSSARKVHAANTHDTVAGGDVFEAELGKYPTLKGVCADAGYRKTFEEFVQNVLKAYPGAMIVISHDADFLEEIGVNSYFKISDGYSSFSA